MFVLVDVVGRMLRLVEKRQALLLLDRRHRCCLPSVRPLKDLAAKTEWTRSRLSLHTTRMQQRGLIERAPDPDDARGCILKLSGKGLCRLRAAAPSHLASVRACFIDVLTSAELATLDRISTRIAGLPEWGLRRVALVDPCELAPQDHCRNNAQ